MRAAMSSVLMVLVAVAGCADGNPSDPNAAGMAGMPGVIGPGVNAGGVGGAMGGVPPNTMNAGVKAPTNTGGQVAPPVTMAGMGGMMMNVPPTTGGVGGMGGMTNVPPMTGGMGGGMVTPTTPETPTEPIIPPVMGECPTWRGGTISVMNLSGITLEVGSKASAPTAPMVFYWHGTGSFAGEYAGSASAVLQGVKSEGGILVSFSGTTGGDLLSGTAIFGAGDFAITDQLVACAVQDYNIDPKRIFATGCSAGGLFSGAMAAARSNYMAAAAPNSGGWTAPVKWQNGNTPALMTIHGAPGVDVVIVDFSMTSATADKAFKARGGFVINCNHGGIHCGGGGLAPDIWEFFKAHPFGTKPSPWEGGLPSGFSSQCKIYTGM